MLIYALHGFLGRPQDWDFLSHHHIVAVDLFKEPITPYNQWAETFNQRVSEDDSQSRILIGYSMGGRLALHALIADPSIWDAAMIISANPGLSCATAKQQRIQHDQQWAHRFRNDPWEQVVTAWNAQPVFKGDSAYFNREEREFDREKLSQSMTTWSLGLQDDLREKLATLPLPITWVSGEWDTKYSQLAGECSLLTENGSHLCVPNAGHRVPWNRA